MKDTFEHYKSLGLEPGASADRVRHAYLQLSHFYDPVRYVGGDAEHVVRADLKRKEIEAAYQEIRRFLPELRGDPNPSPSAFKQDRDINEAVQKPSTDVSKTVIGLVVAAAIALLSAWGYYVYRRTLIFQAPPAPSSPVE